MTPILEFQDVARSFARDRRVLDGVTFSMRAGEVVGLLGRNGAGKMRVAAALPNILPYTKKNATSEASPAWHFSLQVGRLGIEPRTKGLKGPCSTAELPALTVNI